MVGAGRGHLAPAQLETFNRDGVLFPVRGLPSTDAAAMLGNIASFEAERGTDGQPAHPVASDVLRNKAHLKQLWMYDLVHNPELLDAVESVIGPDILCWGASLFVKDGGQVKHVAWHQDSYYWDIGTEKVLTLWIAFAESTAANGALQVLPGTHRQHIRTHGESPEGSSNMIYNVGGNYKEECVELPPGASQDFVPGAGGATTVLLQPGEFALFDVNIVHGSPPNTSGPDERRAGLGIRYCATSAKPGVKAASRQATLVRGVDRFGHFGKDPVPTKDMDMEMVASLDIVTQANGNAGKDYRTEFETEEKQN